MKTKFKLTVKFSTEIEDESKEKTEEWKNFWNNFLQDRRCALDYYIWFYLDIFRDIGFGEVAEMLINRDDTEILKQINDNSQVPTDFLNGSASSFSDKTFLKIQKQLKPPKVFDAQLEELTGENVDFLMWKLANASTYSFTSATIITCGDNNRLIVVEKHKVFDGNFNSLSEAKNGFLKLFGDRAKNILPVWDDEAFKNNV